MLSQVFSKVLHFMAVAVCALALAATGASAQSRSIIPDDASFKVLDASRLRLCWDSSGCVNWSSASESSRRELCSQATLVRVLVSNTKPGQLRRIGRNVDDFYDGVQVLRTRTTNDRVFAAFFPCRTGLGFRHGVLCIDLEDSNEAGEETAYETCMYATES